MGSDNMDSAGFQIEIVDEPMAESVRHRTPVVRFQMAAGLWRSSRALLRGAMRIRHPGWDEVLVHREIARRINLGA